MLSSQYSDILHYKTTGTFPQSFPSTKSNFISYCNKFEVNGKRQLTRDAKLVLQVEDLDRT